MLLTLFCVIFTSKAGLAGSSDIIEVAARAAHENFELRRVTVVAWWKNDDMAAEFLQQYQGTVVTFDAYESHQNIETQQYVLFAQSTGEYNSLLSMIQYDQIDPIRIILIFFNILDTDLLTITQATWKSSVTDFIMLHKDNNTVKLTTYFPYGNGGCDNYMPVTFDASGISEFFPRKFRNFYGCPVRISVLQHQPHSNVRKVNGTLALVSGTEAGLVHHLAWILNCSLVIVLPKDDGAFGSLTEGHWTGTMGDLAYRRADISATSAILNLERFQVIQVSPTYKFLTLAWCAPKRRELLPWARVLRPLFRKSTIIILLSFTMFTTLSTVMAKIRQPDRAWFYYPIPLNAWGVCIGGSVTNLETICWIMNSLMVLWLWVCLILRIAYQGELVKDLGREVLEPRLHTVKEALTVVDGYGGMLPARIFYNHNTTFQSSYQNLSLEEWHSRLDGINKGERFLAACDLWTVWFSGYDMEILDEIVVNAPVTLFMRRQWAASREIDVIIHRLLESGLYRKSIHDFVQTYKLQHRKKYASHSLKFVPLDLLHLSGCFYCMILLYVICFGFLVGEIIWFRMRHQVSGDRDPDELTK